MTALLRECKRQIKHDIEFHQCVVHKSNFSQVQGEFGLKKKKGIGKSQDQGSLKFKITVCLSVCLSLSLWPSFNFDPQIYRRSFQQRMDAESVSGRLMKKKKKKAWRRAQ